MPDTTPVMVNDVPALQPGTTQKIAYTGTAGVISNAVGAAIARVVCTTAAYVKFGDAPTATASDMYMAAEAAEYFHIEPNHKVSAVQVASNGTLIVTAMS